MNFTSLIGLMNNAALLLALGLLYDVLPLRERAARPGLGQALSGLAVGTLGIVVMLNAWVLIPGVIFDTRSVLLALAGLFFGPIPTVIACAMTAAFRYFVQGGAGAWVGMAVIWTSGALGLLWRRLHRGRLEEISAGKLYLLGLAVHIAMLGWMLLLPGGRGPETLRTITAPVMIVHPIATLLLGLVLSGRRVRKQAEAAIHDSEERLRLLTENLREVVSLRGERGAQMLYISPAYEKLWGRPREELLRDPQAFLQYVHPEDRERVIAAQRALYQDGIPLDIEYRITRPDGALRWIAARTYPAPDENGAITRYAAIAEDITERKQSEAAARAQERALRESEARYRTLVEAALEGIMASDRDTRAVFVNRQLAHMLGYTPEEMVGRPVGDFVVADELADHHARMAERRKGLPGRYERRLARRDGGVITTLISAAPLRDEQGAFAGTVALFTDITARKQSEQVLRESEARYRTLVEATHEGVWATDAEFHITFVNQQLAEMLGYRPEELVGLRTIQLMPPDDREDAAQRGAERRAGQAGHYERRLVRRDGSVITTLASGAPLFDERGAFAGAVTLLADITARKQAERALAASERHFRSLIESVQEGVWEADAELRTTFVNRQMADMLGYAPEEMLGRIVSEFVAPDDLADHRALMAERRAGRPGHYERRFTRRDGSVITTLVSATALMDEQGAFVGTVALFTDITERKLTEEALRLQGMVLDQIQDGVTITDLEGVITYVNDAECRMLQRSRSELIGAPVASYGEDPTRGATQQEIIMTTRARGEWRGEVVNYAADGSAVILDTRTQLVRDAAGRPVAMCGIAADITARRQAEQSARDQERALHESEARHKLALEGADLGAWDWNVATGEVIFNDRWAGMLGYRREELTPQLTTWERLVHPDDLPMANQAIADHIAGRTAAYECEHRLRHKDGHWVWVLDRGQAIERDAEGRGVRLCGTHLDITARKEAEEAARASRALYQAFINATDDIAFLKDDQFRYAISNEANDRFLGRPAGEIVGRDDFELMPPDAARGCRASDEATLRERRVVVNIEQVGDRFYEVRKFPTPLQDGRVGVGGYARDVTELRQAQAAAQRFFNVLNASLNELYIFDAQTLRFQFVSAGALRNLGYTLDEMRQMTPLDIKPGFTPEAFDELAAPLRRREAPVVTFEAIHRRKDGATYPVAVNLQLLEEGDVSVFLAVVLDITERRQAERVLRESEDRFRLVLQNANDAIYVHQLSLDRPGRFLDVNDAACRMLGYTQEEFLAMEVPQIDVPEQRERLLKIIPELWDTGRAIFETEHVAKDGRRIPVEVSTRLFEIRGEQVVLSVARDITERRQAEADRARLEEQLAQARRLESIGMLAGGVAHDLNNTLTPILGYGQLLRDELPADDPRHMEVGEIVLSAERARDLVRQLLAFARRQNLVMQPLDLNRVIENLYNMLRRTLRENIAIETHLTPGLGAISGDVGQIEQIILNLAVNAQDAMPQGGALTLETSAATLDEDYAETHEGVAPGPYVLLTVSDTGVGMDKHTLSHLFEPFFTTKEVGKGVGLGLATVYGIVKQHGGHIAAYSEPGLGSTFRLYFPRAGEPLAEGDPARDAARPPRGSETILLVEDQDQVRVLARQLLQRQGYTVLDARNGQAALTIAAAHPGEIHLLVTDVVMPDLNGPALSERLTAVRPGLKTLYMSGYADEVIAPHGVLAQGGAFIQKPFSLPDFVARVRAVLDGD